MTGSTRYAVKGRSSKQGAHIVKVRVLEDGRKKFTNGTTIPSKRQTFRTKGLAKRYGMPAPEKKKKKKVHFY